MFSIYYACKCGLRKWRAKVRILRTCSVSNTRSVLTNNKSIFTMKKLRFLFLTTALLSINISCVTTAGNDDSDYPAAEIETFKGTTNELMAQYTANLRAHSFDIKSLDYAILEISPTQHKLRINVTHGGGEGGCPRSIFVLQWDEQVLEPEPGKKQLNFGLAHFLPNEDHCQALIQQKLEYELRDLVGDQIEDFDQVKFKVTNLYDSSSIEADF